MPAPDVAALLAELERSAPDLADDARTAVDWLTGGEPLETITQLDVCEFLWYTLPIKVSGEVTEHLAIAHALGRLLALGGMERYAALCDDPVTGHILRVYAEEGPEAGTAAYHRALEGTGVLPPDIPELGWSSIMGPEEMGAHLACSAALELAIVSGELAPDDPGWPARREALIRRWLTTPRTELGGDSWLHRVHGERLNRWVLGRGSARRELAQPFEVRLHAPIPAPAGEILKPLRWLLSLAAGPDGIPLTARHNLARAVVVEAAERFGWEVWAPGPPRAEAQVPALRALHAVAEGELGALRRTGRRLLLTAAGRRLLVDRDALWEAATLALLTPAPGEHDYEISVREAALMILAEGRPVPQAELHRRVAEVVGGEGWHEHDEAEVSRPLAELRRRLTGFGLEVPPPIWNGPVRLTLVGQAAALAALRAQALRPRTYVGL